MLRQLLSTILPFLLFVGFYVCVRAFFSSIKRSALHQDPRQNGLALEFFPVAQMQFLVRLVLALLAAFGILVLIAMRNQGGSFYALLIPASVFFLILLVRPVSVVVDSQGIRQQRWFLPDKEVKWNDIASVAHGWKTGTTYIKSRNGGTKIRFSVFLVGKARFIHEIRTHVREGDIFNGEILAAD